jgi:hypothetical protein
MIYPKRTDRRASSLRVCLPAALLMLLTSAQAASTLQPELAETIAVQSQLVFESGFNRCDTEAMAAAVSEDFEFYHDQGGITTGKQAFIDSIRNGICSLDYKATRQAVAGSVQYFPMQANGVIYAVLETGEHQFFASHDGGPAELSGDAKFSILWRKEAAGWRMTRVFSYDHQPASAEK